MIVIIIYLYTINENTMKTFSININGIQYNVEQPSRDYNIFYINRKKGTCCIAKDKNKNWVVEMQLDPTVSIPVEQIGRFLDDQMLIN